MRRKNTHKPKRMKGAARRAERKELTLSPLPRPLERREPEPARYSRIWP